MRKEATQTSDHPTNRNREMEKRADLQKGKRQKREDGRNRRYIPVQTQLRHANTPGTARRDHRQAANTGSAETMARTHEVQARSKVIHMASRTAEKWQPTFSPGDRYIHQLPITPGLME